MDKIILRKRSVIEAINDQLKNINQIEHTRHRSVYNFGAYCSSFLLLLFATKKKPSINLPSDFLPVKI